MTRIFVNKELEVTTAVIHFLSELLSILVLQQTKQISLCSQDKHTLHLKTPSTEQNQSACNCTYHDWKEGVLTPKVALKWNLHVLRL